jgi:hypothetical protein
VGPLRVSFSFPPPFVWSDRDQTSAVDRNRGVTLHWTGMPKGQTMFVVARNVDQLTTAIGMCLCVPDPGAAQFTVPPALLANIPISHELAGVPFDKLLLGTLPAKFEVFAAPGLGSGFVVPFYVSGRVVTYR